MNISDLFFGFRGAGPELLIADAKSAGAKAGDAAGTTFGQQMGSKLKKVAGAAIGAGLGVAVGAILVGARELDAATRQLQADTGMTAAEAAKAEKALAAMYRNNLQGFDEIGRAMAAVHNDLGLAGEEADRTTAKFLKFATATGQDATQAVKAADDILDAWNLTAEDSDHILDLLVASHQKWGGSIDANQQALGQLAPQLKALGVDIEGGVALLNLFEASGMDSSKAMFALNTAVREIKPGQSLDDLIARISAIEDPTERAQEAIKIFGARGGVSLANALRPGITGLSDFAVTAEEAEGATERAADAIESGWGAQFKLLMKNAGGALAEFGTQFGPVLMLAGAFGPQLIAKITGGLGAAIGVLAVGPVGKLVAKAGGIIGGILGTAIGAATHVAEHLAHGLMNLGQAAVVRVAATKAGTIIGAIFGAAVAAGTNLASLLGVALFKVGQMAGGLGIAVKAAGGGLGAALGTTIGTAASVAFAGVMAVMVVQKYNEITAQLDAMGKDIGTSVAKQITDGTLAELQASRAALATGIAELNGVFDLGLFSSDQRKNLQDQMALIDQEIAGRLAETNRKVRDEFNLTGAAVSGTLGTMVVNTAVNASGIVGSLDTVENKGADMGTTYRREVQSMIDATARLRTTLITEVDLLIEGYYAPLQLQMQLQIDKDNLAAATRERNATKAGTAERHQADLTLSNAQQNLDKTRAALLASGKLTQKEQSAWLADLQSRYKTATGTSRTQIQQLIDKIKQLASVSAKNITLTIHGNVPVASAGGNFLPAGQASWVGEEGRELWVPETAGLVIPHGPSEALAAGGAGTTNITIALPAGSGPLNEFEVAAQLRRLADFGVLSPRPT